MKRFLVVGFVLAFSLYFVFIARHSRKVVPELIGLTSLGALYDCPDKPNCVLSYESADEDHYMPAYKFEGTHQIVMYKLSGSCSTGNGAQTRGGG